MKWKKLNYNGLIAETYWKVENNKTYVSDGEHLQIYSGRANDELAVIAMIDANNPVEMITLPCKYNIEREPETADKDFMIDYIDDTGKTYKHIKAKNFDEAVQLFHDKGLAVEIIDVYEVTDPTF